jgi:hypothetical protein
MDSDTVQISNCNANPYTLHSFRELRAVTGRAWVACHSCLRFVELRLRDDRDTRVTTFSCCLWEVRESLHSMIRPSRACYTILAPVRRGTRIVSSLCSRSPGSTIPSGIRHLCEDLPQREKPRREPAPRYRLKPMPFRTLGEALAAGLVVKVYCMECRRYARPELPLVAHDRCFAKLLFRCGNAVQRWPTMPRRLCRSRGRLQLEPPERISPSSRIRRV